MATQGNPVRPSTDQGFSELDFYGLLTVDEAAAFLRIGRNTCYELIRKGQIPFLRLGRLIRVPRNALLCLVSEQAGTPEDGRSISVQRH